MSNDTRSRPMTASHLELVAGRFFDSAVERDAEDLRETADLLDRLKYHENALWLRRVATRHEVIAGAYRTADAAREAAGYFFAWFNRHYPPPSTNEAHEYNRLAKFCWSPSAEEVAAEAASRPAPTATK